MLTHLRQHILALQEELQQQRHAATAAFKLIDYTFAAIDAQLHYSAEGGADAFGERVQELEGTLVGKLEEEDEELRRSQLRLSNDITEGISFVSQSWKQEQRLERSTLASLSSLMRSQFAPRHRPASLQTSLLPRLKHKTALLAAELKKMQDKNVELRSRTKAELKQTAKLLDELDEGRRDRETKEEQILAKVEELGREETGVGSRTHLTSKTLLE